MILDTSISGEALFVSPSVTTTQTLSFRLLARSANWLVAQDEVNVAIKPSQNTFFAANVIELKQVSDGKPALGISFDSSSDAQIKLIENSPALSSDLVEFSLKTSGMTSASVKIHLSETNQSGHRRRWRWRRVLHCNGFLRLTRRSKSQDFV